MKKYFLLLMLTIILSISLVGDKAYAASSSIGKSEGTINFTAGDGEITLPVNPKNPDDPTPLIPIDPSDPKNPGTGQKGPLSIDYVSNLKFGQHKIKGKSSAYKVLNENPFVQVTDTRGSGNEWSLFARMSTFKSSNNQILKGATLVMKNSIVKAGSSSNISIAPIKSDILFDNEENQLVLNAKDKSGRGTWLNVWAGENQANEAIQLNVVAGTPEANTEYTSAITWELADAPN